MIELPDGNRYFSIAQMVRRPVAPHPQPQPRFAIGLGCEIRHAAKLIYANGIDLEKTEGTPIGVNCRLCERENCSQRAEPPITRTLILDENTRRVSSFRVLQCKRALILPVIASASEAIHGAAGGGMDCFVATLLAMTARCHSGARVSANPESRDSGFDAFASSRNDSRRIRVRDLPE